MLKKSIIIKVPIKVHWTPIGCTFYIGVTVSTITKCLNTVKPLHKHNGHHWEPTFCVPNSGASVGMVYIIGLLWLNLQSFPLLYAGKEG